MRARLVVESLGWTTREQARLIAERRGCDFLADDGLPDTASE
jgi:hypothetical protein